MTRYILPVFLAFAVGMGAYFMLGSSSQTSFALPEANAQTAADVDTSGIVEMSLGDADAPVTMIEYASFTCPHCAAFHTNVFPQIKENYIDTGKVRFIVREVYFDRPGLWAGMTARCGGPVRYFGVSDMLYKQQRDWTQGGGEQVLGNLRRIGLTAGLTPDQFDACMQDAAKAEALYANYIKQAEADEVTGTPSFIINGEKQRNGTYEDLAAVLDAALGE